ncbi:MAG: oligoribonuclease [Egibacteraceae bacterium]
MDDPLVWIDLEMTGLDPVQHVILEVAVIVSDGALEHVVEGPDLVIAASEDALAAMIPLVAEMHATSGLLDTVRRSGVTLAEAEAQVLGFVRAHVPEPQVAPLAGNSVHADRAFLARWMPALNGWLHYRNVDVSTVKELARRWYPDAYASAPKKAKGHRALADIRESIAELRHYRATIFKERQGPITG